MGNVPNLDDQRPHEACIVQCQECRKKHVAVYVVGTTFPIQCHACGLMEAEQLSEPIEGWDDEL